MVRTLPKSGTGTGTVGHPGCRNSVTALEGGVNGYQEVSGYRARFPLRWQRAMWGIVGLGVFVWGRVLPNS